MIVNSKQLSNLATTNNNNTIKMIKIKTITYYKTKKFFLQTAEEQMTRFSFDAA